MNSLGSIDPAGLAKVTEAVKSFIPDSRLRELVTPEAIVESFYPYDNTTNLSVRYHHLMKTPDDILSTYYPEVYDEIINPPDESDRCHRSLSVLTSVPVDFIPDAVTSRQLATSCLSAVTSFVFSVIGVMLAFVPLLSSPVWPKVIGTYLSKIFITRLGSNQAFIDYFLKNIDEGLASASVVKRAWSWVKGMWQLVNVGGIKFLYYGIRDAIAQTKPSMSLYLYTLGALLTQIIAWSTTGWTAFILSAITITFQLAIFVQATSSMISACKKTSLSDDLTLTLYSDTPCVTNEGEEGTCIDVKNCTERGKVPKLWKEGDPEPSCQAYSDDVACCINA